MDPILPTEGASRSPSFPQHRPVHAAGALKGGEEFRPGSASVVLDSWRSFPIESVGGRFS